MLSPACSIGPWWRWHGTGAGDQSALGLDQPAAALGQGRLLAVVSAIQRSLLAIFGVLITVPLVGGLGASRRSSASPSMPCALVRGGRHRPHPVPPGEGGGVALGSTAPAPLACGGCVACRC